MKVFGFLLMYLVNFFFVSGSFKTGMIVAERVLFSDMFGLLGVLIFSFVGIQALDSQLKTADPV